MDIDQTLALIHSVGEEVIEDEGQLAWLIQNKDLVIAYDGFEPSGRIHIAQGLLRALNINKLITAITPHTNFKFIMLIADWHAAANEKFGGDLDVIKKVGDYFVEIWKACGLDLNHVEFRYASELVKDPTYWELVLKTSMNASLNRVKRCTQIMGRDESYNLKSSQILYPLMQTADIFYMDVDICQLGLDQRKVNMLAREVASNLGKRKPASIHHHMLMGLKKPPSSELGEIDQKVARKMSKSDPDSAIFMMDSAKDVKRKIQKAYCPPNTIHENPIMEYCEYIIFEKFDIFQISRPEKYGGDVEYGSYGEIAAAYENGSLSPVDLKNGVIEYLNKLLQPIRDHFEQNSKAAELFDFVTSQN
jgi:tyrosyl-tRNA synthetase